jgi:PAS domain S-box-containing protein
MKLNECNQPFFKRGFMTLQNKRITLYIVITSAIIALSLGLGRAGFHSDKAFHENISLISAMFSLFTGLLSMIRYYAKKICPYLWVGLAFAGNGLIELIYSFSFYALFSIPTGINTFMIWGPWMGKIYLSVMLLGSYVTCRRPTSKPTEIIAYTVALILSASCIIALLFLRLPTPAFGYINRPFEFLPGMVLTTCLLGFLQFFDWQKMPFPHWLICGVIVLSGIQLFIIPFSQHVYDARFVMSNLLRAISYILVAVGLLAEIFKLYRRYEDESIRLTALRLAVNQVKDYAVFMLDTNGYIMTWNKGAEKIKGYREDEIIGKHFSIFYSEKERRKGKPEYELRQAVEEGHAIDEDWRIKKDGSRFWASVIITPVYDKANTLIGFAKITKDLTQVKLTEEKLRRQNVALTSANEQLTQFAYIATHDLKEPLRTISSFTQLLTRVCDRSNAMAEKYADFITKAVERTRRLVDDLRTYSLIKSKNVEQETANLNTCVSDAINLLKKKIEDTHAEIKTCKLPLIKGSPTQLMYLFLHLIDNAIKYAKAGQYPVIEVCCSEKKTEYIISVKDNGMGIPQEYTKKIFSIFHKLNDRNKTGGTGIGLFICKNVVAAHGGRMWFNSGQNGTTFYFALPMISSIAAK